MLDQVFIRSACRLIVQTSGLFACYRESIRTSLHGAQLVFDVRNVFASVLSVSDASCDNND